LYVKGNTSYTFAVRYHIMRVVTFPISARPGFR
jgi:hypothetical protein